MPTHATQLRYAAQQIVPNRTLPADLVNETAKFSLLSFKNCPLTLTPFTRVPTHATQLRYATQPNEPNHTHPAGLINETAKFSLASLQFVSSR